MSFQFSDQVQGQVQDQAQDSVFRDSRLIQATRLSAALQSDFAASCRILVHRSSIPLDPSFRQEIYQAIQGDDLYASILHELEDGEWRDLQGKKIKIQN